MKKVTKQTYINWYKDMLFWRKFEDKLASVYIQQKVRGFLHLYNGQEAVLAGALHAMDLSKDKMITAYRNHVQPIGMGEDPKRVMAELYGKVTGTSKGMGGSMHIFSKKHGFYGGHGIVGGQIPLGAGLAFADMYQGKDHVTCCYFGDGAVRQGSFHETMNMAMLWNIPAVFVIENNGYGLSTPTSQQYRCAKLVDKAIGYGIEGYQIDGYNILEVYNQVSALAASVRERPRPILLEFITFRMRGHEEASGTKYVPKDLFEQWSKKDPVHQFEQYLVSEKILDNQEIEQIKHAISTQIEQDLMEVFAEPEVDFDPQQLTIEDIAAEVEAAGTGALEFEEAVDLHHRDEAVPHGEALVLWRNLADDWAEVARSLAVGSVDRDDRRAHVIADQGQAGVHPGPNGIVPARVVECRCMRRVESY